MEDDNMNKNESCAPREMTACGETSTAPIRGAPLFVDTRAASLGCFPLSPRTPTLELPATLPPLLISASLLLVALAMLKPIRRRARPRVFPSSTGLPPCAVPAHPILGHMRRVYSPPDSADFASVMVDNADPSGISTFWLLNAPCVSVLKADHARTVFRNSIERKSFRPINRHFSMCLGKDSLVTMACGVSDRGKWRRHRNLMKAGFTHRAVENMADKVWKVANRFAASILRECSKKDRPDKNQGSFCAEADDILKLVTIDIFGEVAFNQGFGGTESLATTPLTRSLGHTVEDTNTRCQPANLLRPSHQFYWLPTRKNREYKLHSKNIHDTLQEICRQRTREISSNHSQCSENGDLLTALLRSMTRSRDVTPDDPHEDLVGILLTLFFAGYDTSSVLLSMAMWVVARRPEIQRECAAEARAGERALREDASQWESRLAYCRAVIAETLRLHPPVYINSRDLSKDVVLDGRTVPATTRVYFPVAQIHADGRNFARAAEFLPERWARRDLTTGRWVARDHKNEPAFVENNETYLPPADPRNIFSFGDGARNCVGHRLALQESTFILACLVRDLTVHMKEGFVMRKRRKFALAPPKEMPLIFRKREI